MLHKAILYILTNAEIIFSNNSIGLYTTFSLSCPFSVTQLSGPARGFGLTLSRVVELRSRILSQLGYNVSSFHEF